MNPRQATEPHARRHFYIPEAVADRTRLEADRLGQTMSKFVTRALIREFEAIDSRETRA